MTSGQLVDTINLFGTYLGELSRTLLRRYEVEMTSNVGLNLFRKSSQPQAFGPAGFVGSFRPRTLRWSIALLACIVIGVNFSGSAQAGCHSLGEDWYRDYHHGHLNAAGQAFEEVSKWQTPQVFIFEDGQMRAIPNPLPPLCQGPQCQEGPSKQNLGGMGSVEQLRNVSLAMRSVDRSHNSWPKLATDAVLPSNLKSIAGFPASLDEPPR